MYIFRFAVFRVWISHWFMHGAFKGLQLARVCILQIHDCVIFFFFPSRQLDRWISFQVRDWPREAGGAERSGSADPADSGTGEMAERDDGAEIQAVHGRWWGGNVQDTGRTAAALSSGTSQKPKKKKAETFVFLWRKRYSYCQIWAKAAGLKLKCSDLISQTNPLQVLQCASWLSEAAFINRERPRLMLLCQLLSVVSCRK